MATDLYFREGIKWAKVSGSRGARTAAMGWKGDFQAAKTFRYPTKLGAEVAAQYWVKDQ